MRIYSQIEMALLVRVGNNPFVSPVPLEALKHYKLIHSSDESITQPSVGVVPEVKIFEYIGR